jgi:16S rRNA (adenine1518-N6/adenine1519-N6)-dimethyltransferase
MNVRKRFGQHFLEPAWAEKVVNAIAPASDETFVEVGPGRGALTVPLARRSRHVVAVEIDRDLVAAASRWAPPNVTLIGGSFLDVDLEQLLKPLPRPVRAAGNLPYNAASPILVRMLSAAGEGRQLRDATLMLQKEVADRVAARPGSRDYGALSVMADLAGERETILTLPPGAFRPAPKVTSAVVRLRFRPPPVEVGDPTTFARLVRGVFLHRRKTLANALRWVGPELGQSLPQLLARAGVDGRLRPEELTLSDFASLSRAVL